MAKAVFRAVFRANHPVRGVTVKVRPHDEPRSYPRWIIDQAIAAGAAELINTKSTPAVTGIMEK